MSLSPTTNSFSSNLWPLSVAPLRLVSRAPGKLQAAAVLYYVDGLEQDQVAKTLGISRRTVINRLQEFMDRSRKFLTREGGDA